jgi:mono/diheme cytochrome c family protein
MTSSSCRVTIFLARVLLVAVGITGISGAAGCIDATATLPGNASAEQSIVTASESDSADRGRTITEVHCDQCHGPDFLQAFQNSRSDWLVTIDRMEVQYGGTITPEEREILADYLASNFGPDG